LLPALLDNLAKSENEEALANGSLNATEAVPISVVFYANETDNNITIRIWFIFLPNKCGFINEVLNSEHIRFLMWLTFDVRTEVVARAGLLICKVICCMSLSMRLRTISRRKCTV